MKINPKRDNVLVKVFLEEKKTKGGIYVVESDINKQSPDRGTVIATGEGRMTANGVKIPMTVSPGDHIVFQKYAGTEIKIDDDVFLMIKENDILAVIEQ